MDVGKATESNDRTNVGIRKEKKNKKSEANDRRSKMHSARSGNPFKMLQGTSRIEAARVQNIPMNAERERERANLTWNNQVKCSSSWWNFPNFTDLSDVMSKRDFGRIYIAMILVLLGGEREVDQRHETGSTRSPRMFDRIRVSKGREATSQKKIKKIKTKRNESNCG